MIVDIEFLCFMQRCFSVPSYGLLRSMLLANIHHDSMKPSGKLTISSKLPHALPSSGEGFINNIRATLVEDTPCYSICLALKGVNESVLGVFWSKGVLLPQLIHFSLLLLYFYQFLPPNPLTQYTHSPGTTLLIHPSQK